MTATKYKVSVIVPAYKAGKHVAQTLNSVLAQRRKAQEIMVVNDCSTDDTLPVVAGYAQAHPDLIKVLNTPANSGVSAARNLGIQAARGDLIALLDGDDYWKDSHLSTLADPFRRRRHDSSLTAGNPKKYNV